MIRFGSRGSDLAQAQTKLVGDLLERRTGEGHGVETIQTRGDHFLDTPLSEVGGKGLFTAELEAALRSGRIDAAVHSLKDLPVEDPEDLVLGAIPERAAAHDVLVYRLDCASSEGGTLPINDGSVVGTSSPRRAAAVLAHRPHLVVRNIRGNVPTRIAKLRSGEYDATLLAAAGLQRLELSTDGLGVAPLPTGTFTPAPGQGALAVQCRRDDPDLRRLLARVHDQDTAARVGAERSLLQSLGGGCSMPLGALVERSSGGYRMRATLYAGGRPAHRFSLEFEGPDPAELAERAARALRPLTGEPLKGLRICLVRPAADGGSLAAGLAVAGAEVHPVALTEIVPLDIGAEGVESIRTAPVVAFTSARAVDRYFELAALNGIEPGGKRYYAGGPATASAVVARGLHCDAPGRAGGASLGRLISQTEGDGDILFPCARGRRPELESAVRQGGRRVIPLPVYETRTIRGVELPDGPWHYTVFTSPSAIQAFADGGHHLQGRSLAIGPTTARAMLDLAMKPDGVADDPTPQALSSRITELQHAHST